MYEDSKAVWRDWQDIRLTARAVLNYFTQAKACVTWRVNIFFLLQQLLNEWLKSDLCPTLENLVKLLFGCLQQFLAFRMFEISDVWRYPLIDELIFHFFKLVFVFFSVKILDFVKPKEKSINNEFWNSKSSKLLLFPESFWSSLWID